MKTGEMIKVLTENPNKKFKCLSQNQKGNIVGLNENRVIDWIENDKFQQTYFSIIRTIDWEWEEVEEPVDFMTAVNSGRKIRAERYRYYYPLGQIFEMLSLDDINGKWYIE